MKQDSLAEALGVTPAPGTVRIERLLPGPIERIWEYLVDSEKRSRWLAAGSMELRVGGQVELLFRHEELSAEKATPDRFKSAAGEPHIQRCHITACEPPRLLSFTWGESGEVTFELVPRGGDVFLVVTHRRLADLAAMTSVASGWHAHLGILIDRLSEREPRGFWSAYEAAQAQYESRFVQ